MEGYWCYWHGFKGYSGVAMHVRKDISPERPRFEHPAFDYEHRIITAEVAGITVASIYVPNGGKDFPAKMRFLGAMAALADSFKDSATPLVLCGDLNVARADIDVHPKERKPMIIGQRPDERALFEAMLANGLVDLGRALDPRNEGMFTWWAPWRNMRQRNIGWRLDYILASESLAQKAVSCPVLADFGASDHAPVVATFAL